MRFLPVAAIFLAVSLYAAASPSQRPVGAQTAPEWTRAPLDAPARLLHAFSRSAKEEMAFPNRTGGGDPSPPSAPGLLTVVVGGSGNQTDEAGPTDSPVSGSASSATLDLKDWALATPALKPLASDCRLPCYGVERRGPASWYRDWRYGPSAQYAAIPGYLGGVVAVAVCTFPDGQANCATFPVVDSCQCYRHEKRERVIDLSPAAYSLFAPLSTGLVMVQVTVLP